MLFQWPSLHQIVYRVMRLRRLVAVAVMVPMLALIAMSLLSPAALPADLATMAVAGIAALVIGHVVLFPNVTLETLALSIAATLLVCAMPAIMAAAAWAPAAQQTGALVILIGFAFALAGFLVLLLENLMAWMFYAGPAIKRVMTARIDLPCSPQVAFQQFTLRPDTRRGRILTGPADDNGFFDVAVAHAAAEAMHPDHAAVVRVDAKVLESSPARHDVMLLTAEGAVTVTSQSFAATPEGCTVEVRDMPGDFTLGMYAIYWLTDQQADNLTEMSDPITGQTPRANGIAHQTSLMAVAGAVLSPRAPMAD